jgi:putative oxidoreductase
MTNRDASAYGSFVLRIATGAVFLAHAYQKMFIMTLPGTAQFFAAHGFPGWMAYPVFTAELLGGLLLLLGTRVREVSLVLIPVLLGALMVHWPNGWFFAAPKGGWEFIAYLAVGCFAQAMLGAGAFAIDLLPSFRLFERVHLVRS